MTKKLSGLFFATCMLFGSLSSFSLSASAVKPDVAVSIDEVSVSMHQLERAGYEVPVFIRVEQNVNLNAIEFGLEIDQNCRFECITKNIYAQLYNEMLDIEMSCASSPDIDGCAWITWAQKEPYFQETSNILLVLVKVPETTQPGDIYSLHYLTQSPLNAEKNHVWYNYGTKTDYTATGTVTWTDGYIQITDDEQPLAGDANLDGEIDILDVILINKAVLGKEILTFLQTRACDVDSNGIVDATDSLNIMKFIVGLSDI